MRKRTTAGILLVATACFFVSGNALATGDAERGKKVFNKCKTCHSSEEKNMVGPNLKGIVGRKIASAAGYNYSPALKAKEGIWDTRTLDAWIESPRNLVPGNRDTYPGIKNASDRDDLIAYLATVRP
jgi:cytochrome c